MSSSTNTVITNSEKTLVWKSYHEYKPIRVPVRLGTNPRVVLLNPQWNPKGYTFEQAAEDPRIHLEVALQHCLYQRTQINQYADEPTGLPACWEVSMNVYNVYEAAILGAPLEYLPGQVPDTKVFLDESHKLEIFEQDISLPMENPYIKDRMAFWSEMEKISSGMQFEGRPVRLLPWSLLGTDGPVTVAMNLRGSDFMEDLVVDPEYADRLMRFITQAAINRRAAFEAYWGDRVGHGNGMADDSIAMLSTQMYKEQVLPIHRMFYDAVPAKRARGMHLCGNATRHFPLIHEQLGVTSFDTGFPVNFGELREKLGDDVEVSGGVEVAMLMNGTSDQVYQRTQTILQSGIIRGGRFVMREGNNLPPNTPLENLAAMYQATLDFGRYDQ